MIAQPSRTDSEIRGGSDALPVRSAVHDTAPSVPAPVAPPVCAEIPDPSGFGFAAPAVPPVGVRAPRTVRRPARAPQRPPRWPHIAVAVCVPAAGVAGFLAAVLSSAMPLQIVTYAVVGGVAVFKIRGPVRAVTAVIAALIAKVGK